MVKLDLNVNIKLYVSDELNARLEQGEPEAFVEVEEHIRGALQLKALTAPRTIGHASEVQIQDAGPYNVIWKDKDAN